MRSIYSRTRRFETLRLISCMLAMILLPHQPLRVDRAMAAPNDPFGLRYSARGARRDIHVPMQMTMTMTMAMAMPMLISIPSQMNTQNPAPTCQYPQVQVQVQVQVQI